MTDAMVIRRLMGILASPSLGVRRDIGAAALGELMGIGLTVGAPYSLKVLVDTLPIATLPSTVLVLSIAAFVLTWSGASLTGALRLVLTTRIVDRLAERLAADAMASELPRTALTTDVDASRSSSALERLPFSLQIIIEGVAGRVLPLSLQLAIALGLIGLAAPPRYAAMMAGVIIAFLAAAQAGADDFQKRADAVNGSLAALSAVVGDLFHNSGRVVFNGAMTSELGHVAALAARRRQADVALATRLATMSALQYGVLCLGLGILLLSAARDVEAHRLPVGDFVLLQAYAFRLALPLSGLGLIWRQAGAALANVKDVLCMIKTQDCQRYRAPPTGGALSLTHVSYSYDAAGRGVDDVSLTIPPGATVAIVGQNGSGKSTLARLIAGLLTPDSGAVAVAGVEINTLALAERPAWVLYAPQFIGLLNRTLEENGRYPPSALTTAELTSALDRWGFEPGGRLDLKRMVGTRGASLSGGQVQKLELARLIGISAPVLVLDEATSALDAASARRALLDLRSAHPDQTLIAVTHSADVARWVDRVLYLEAGRLVADGPHDDLMVRSHEYGALWRPMDN